MDTSRRRRFLQTVVGVSTIGLAGCSLLSSEQPGENQEEPPEITDTPASTPTSTPVPVPDDASFEFDYSDESLTIRLTGGGPIPASNLVVRSSDGTQVRWHKLGSTAVPASGSATSGDTATIGSSVLNWPNAVRQSETIRVVFVTESGSPTTLGMYKPSATDTPTETETDTPAETGYWFDGFERDSTSNPARWRAAPEHPPNEFRITDEDAAEGSKSLYVLGNYDGVDSSIGNVHSVPDLKYSQLQFNIKHLSDTSQFRIMSTNTVTRQESIGFYKIKNGVLQGFGREWNVTYNEWLSFEFDFKWDGNDLGWELSMNGDVIDSRPTDEFNNNEKITGVVFVQADFGEGEHYIDNVSLG